MSSPELILEMGRQMVDNPPMVPAGDAPVSRFTAPDASLAVLLDRSKDGDTAAMESIYLRFKGAFYNLAYRYGGDRATAEDLLQDIFIKIFTHIEDVRSPEMFPGWAYRIALNSCYSHLREKKSKARQTISLTDLGESGRRRRNGARRIRSAPALGRSHRRAFAPAEGSFPPA